MLRAYVRLRETCVVGIAAASYERIGEAIACIRVRGAE